MLSEETIDYNIRKTWYNISKMYNRTAAKFDSTMATGFALLSIDAEGTPSTALGPKMGMEGTSISRLLKSMEERELIDRRPDPSDGRGVLIHLTPFGKEKREFSKQIVLFFSKLSHLIYFFLVYHLIIFLFFYWGIFFLILQKFFLHLDHKIIDRIFYYLYNLLIVKIYGHSNDKVTYLAFYENLSLLHS